MAEIVALTDRSNSNEQWPAPERPPKLTQDEADYLLAEGPYIGRLAAARRTLDIAMRFSDEESAFLFPVGHVDNLEAAVVLRQGELNDFSRNSPFAETVNVKHRAIAKKVVAICADEDRLASAEQTSAQRTTAPTINSFETSVQMTSNNHSELRLLDDSDPAAHWQDRALCAQTDPEAFFPDKGGSTRQAKKICLSCEVREDCLEAAIMNDERFGIWGGLSERERRKIKRNGTTISAALNEGPDEDAESSGAELFANRDDERLHSPKIDHAGRIRQLVQLCGLTEDQAEDLEFDDGARERFVIALVENVYKATSIEKGVNAGADISRLTNYFLIDDIAKIWTLFDQSRDYWEDMTHLLIRFKKSIEAVQVKQQEYEADFSETIENYLENAQFDLNSRSA